MDFFTSMNLSSSALRAQRERMNVISSNLANVNTTRTEEGGPYRKKSVVFKAVDVNDKFNTILKSNLDKNINSVKVDGVVEDKGPGRLVFEPNHPDANKDGYVEYPNISLVSEMVDMLNTTRAYEANVTVMATSKTMANKALQLLGQ